MTTSKSFIDQTRIFIKAGDGGNGCVSFRREKYIPRGGPDGGDGGRGGDIILVGTRHRATLNHFRKKHHFKARSGNGGEGNQRTGANGESVTIEVPLGTIVHDESTDTVVGEIVEHGQTILVQKGGNGGFGNYRFRTSTNQAPTKALPGQEIEGKWIRLELKLLADVGIVGLPNAGKSTLLSTLTHAKSKVADYPFTTLFPYLGILDHRERRLTLADMPGLIKDAHLGAGLGTRFLRHIERTKVLLYMTAANPDTPSSAYDDFLTCQREVHYYNEELKTRAYVIAVNKIDLLPGTDSLGDVLRPFHAKGFDPVPISAATGQGIDALMERLNEKL